MSDRPPTGTVPLPLARVLDRACDEFEAAWKAAGPRGKDRPQLPPFLGPLQGEERAALLKELVALDVAYRRRLGEKPAPADYRRAFPNDGGLIAAVFREEAPQPGRPVDEEATLPPETARPAPAVPAVPSVPGYELREELGRGGMGVVYKARHLALKRVVALKMILAGAHAGPKELARFRSEAETVARLQHPNVVQIYEVGEHEGLPYCALEYCDGGSLAGRLKGRPLKPRQAAGIAQAISRAMHHAHRAGVVHRDLKPQNVLLTSVGLPKVTDFGLAKQLDGAAGHTATGAVLGTPSYMAPEQAAGKEVGPAADVWALGAVLYELLTGRPPFLAETPLDTVMQVVTTEPVPPARLQPGCPRDLETICLKCLRKEPPKRYATAEDLADDLQRFLRGEPIRARPVGPAERLFTWARRRPAPAALLLLLTAAVLTAVGAGTWFARHEYEQRLAADDLARQARENEGRARDKEKAEAAARADAQLRAAHLALDRGQALCAEGDAAEGMVWLAHALTLAPDDAADLRRAVAAHLAFSRPGVRRLQACLAQPGGAAALAVSPRGEVLVTLGGTAARRWDAVTHQPLEPPLTLPEGGRGLAFSPDGRLVVACTLQQAQVWEAASGQAVSPPFHLPGRFAGVAFSADGKSVITSCTVSHDDGKKADGRVTWWDPATGKEQRSVERARSQNGLAVSPDGKRLVLVERDWHGAVLDGARGESLAEFDFVRPVRAFAFNPADATRFLAAGDDRRAELWDVTTHRPVDGFPPLRHQGRVAGVAFSRDGKLVLTGSDDGRAQLWDGVTGKPLGAPLVHQAPVRAVAFSPDGGTLFTGSLDGGVRVWDNPAAEEVGWGPRQQHGRIFSLAFTPDGKRILTGGYGQAYVRDAATGKEKGLALAHPPAFVKALAVSPDGKAAATVGEDPGVRVWNLDDHSLRFTLPHKTVPVPLVRFRPGDGKVLLTASQNTVHAWDAATGKPLPWSLDLKAAVTAAVFTPDGRLIGTGAANGAIGLWDASTGAAQTSPPGQGGRVTAVAFSPDGRRLLSCGAWKARLWDVAEHRAVGEPMTHRGEVVTARFSPDGRRVVTASADRTARVWDAETGQPVTGPLPHQGEVTVAAFSPDGRAVLTGSADGTARLWDAATGQPVSPPLRHDAGVLAGDFSPDGRLAVTGTDELENRQGGDVHGWAVPPPVEGGVERLVVWTQVLTGLEVDANGRLLGLGAAEWDRRRRRLEELGGPP
jgi:WD40 repeat protein